MNQSLGTAEEWQRWIVARKLIAGEILTDLELKKAAEWIVGQPINLPEGTGNPGKKRGRTAGPTDVTVSSALIFQSIRPGCDTDTEAYQKIQEELAVNGINVGVDTVRKNVKAGKAAIETKDEPDYEEMARVLWARAEREIMRNLDNRK